MQGDFSRNTFDPTHHFLRVLMQQGRVQVDADWNEQTAILLHYLQALARDLIGPHGGPGDSFRLTALPGRPKDFRINPGHYYVNGLLCENDAVDGVTYTQQADYPLVEADMPGQGRYLVYLDVWERHITYYQEATIREVALGMGVDTATRAQLVWQVKIAVMEGERESCETKLAALKNTMQPANRGQLKARAQATEEIDATNPCILPPEARYRGPENQLYRVEIHEVNDDGKAYFKWSRENGTVTFPILSIADKTVMVEHLGMDSRFSLQEGDWVELVDDHTALRNEPEPLYKVATIDRVNLKLTLDKAPDEETGHEVDRHPLLRRWDQRVRVGGPAVTEAGVAIQEGTGNSNWLTLEDGIQIQFQSQPPGATYRVGDYWLIPARTAIGDVLWPRSAGTNAPLAVAPHGITHHYAPLGIINFDANGAVESEIEDCRCELISLCELSDALRNRRA